MELASNPVPGLVWQYKRKTGVNSSIQSALSIFFPVKYPKDNELQSTAGVWGSLRKYGAMRKESHKKWSYRQVQEAERAMDKPTPLNHLSEWHLLLMGQIA